MKNLLDQLINGCISPLSRFELTCEPVTIGMGVMAAGSAAMSIAGQFQARDAHNQSEEARRIATENAIEENRRRATHDYLTSTRLEREQQAQEEAALVQKKVDVFREADRTIATALASAAERNVAGRTVDMIAADFEFMANEETGRLRENQKLANQQHAENIRAAGTEWQNRVTSIKPYVKTPAQRINFFGPIFQAGAQTLTAVSKMPEGTLKGPGFGAASSTPSVGAQTNWADAGVSVGVDKSYLKTF